MNRFWGHDSVVVRFIHFYGVGLLLFFTSWSLAYLMLPEGALIGIGILGNVAGDTAANTQTIEFLRIFGLNLIGLLLIVIGNYVLRVNSFSFGYLVPLAWLIMYGVMLGTNSFSIPLNETMAPTLKVFKRSGLYEMMAYVLFAVATNTVSANKSKSFFAKSEPVPKKERTYLKKEQWIAMAVAILILGGAAYREAYMIVNL